MKIILASGSPRRKQLLAEAGFEFSVAATNVEEVWPPDLDVEKVPEYLACLKASALKKEAETAIVIAADTIVVLNNEIIGKPANEQEAKSFLTRLSGKTHTVITGVCINYQDTKEIFSDYTDVYFNPLSEQNIQYYVDTYKPLDKAGAYGIQEWIGLIGVRKIEGSYPNVMGLPIDKVAEILRILIRMNI